MATGTRAATPSGMTKAAAAKLARMLRAQGYKVRVVRRRVGRAVFWVVERL